MVRHRRKKQKKEKWKSAVRGVWFFALVVLAITTILCSFFLKNSVDAELKKKSAEFEKPWTTQTNVNGVRLEKMVDLPLYNYDNGPGEMVITNTLPQVTDDMVLVFCWQTQKIRVYVDNERIYETVLPQYGQRETRVGTEMLIIPMKAEYSGKEIKVYMEPLSSFQEINLKDIMLGTISDYKLSILGRGCAYLIIGILMIFAALVSFGAFFYNRIRKTEIMGLRKEAYWHMGLLFLGISIWGMTKNQLLSVLTGHQLFNGILYYLALMIIPVALLGLMRALHPVRSRLMDGMTAALELNLAVQVILFHTGVADLPDMVFATYLLLWPTVLITLWYAVMDFRKSDMLEKHLLWIAIIPVALLSLVVLGCYIILPELEYTIWVFTGAGVLLAALGILCIYRQYNWVLSQRELKKNNEFLSSYSDGLHRNLDYMKEMEQGMAVVRHDMRHTMRLISAYLDSGSIGQIRELLGQIDESLDKTKPRFFCENVAVNGVLVSVSVKAAHSQVELICQTDVPKTLEKISEMEFATVVSNLLDNAVNAAAKVRDENNRKVWVNISPVKSQILIDISNTYEGVCTINPQTGLPRAVQKDGHGYGLYSIQIYAKKWDTTYTCTCENQILRFSMLV